MLEVCVLIASWGSSCYGKEHAAVGVILSSKIWRFKFCVFEQGLSKESAKEEKREWNPTVIWVHCYWPEEKEVLEHT